MFLFSFSISFKSQTSYSLTRALPLARYKQTADHTCQQQHTDSLEWQQITVFIRTYHMMTYRLHTYFDSFHIGCGNELMLQNNEQYNNSTD